MSTHWENDWGDEFETREDAFNDACERMDRTDLNEELGMVLSYSDLLDWCWRQPNFIDEFYEAIEEAERNWFENNYYEVEDEEE